MIIVTQNNKLVNFCNVTQIGITNRPANARGEIPYDIMADLVDGSATTLGTYAEHDMAKDVLSRILNAVSAETKVIALP